MAQFVEQMRLGNSLGRQNESYFERGIPSVVRASPKNDGCRRALNTFYCFWCSPQVRMCVCVYARARVCVCGGAGENSGWRRRGIQRDIVEGMGGGKGEGNEWRRKGGKGEGGKRRL